MLAVDKINPHATLSHTGSFSDLANSRVAKFEPGVSHPPRIASLSNGSGPVSRSVSSSTAQPQPVRIPRAYKDIKIDHWTKRIFQIISVGPAGGFVSYAISPTNELFVDRTGNRGSIEDVTSDLLPKESCRYIAYRFRFDDEGQERMKVIWFMWTPKDASQADTLPYLNGLAGTLIGLNCQSSIPIVKAKSADEITADNVILDISTRRASASTTDADSTRTSSS